MVSKNSLLQILLVHLAGLHELVNSGKVVPVKLTETEPEFHLEYPRYPWNPAKRTNRTWDVSAPDGGGLRLHCTDIFLQWRINCSKGVLSIRDSRGQVKLCSQTSSYTRESKGNWMTVQFTTGSDRKGRINCVVSLITNDVVRQDLQQMSCPCGMAKKDGDQERAASDYPFVAAIWDDKRDRHVTGGTILTQRHILTKSWDLPFKKSMDSIVSDLVVHVGGNRIDKYSKTSHVQRLNVSWLDQYSIARILVLSEDIQFTEYVWPICLPTKPYYHLQEFRAIGWLAGPVVSSLESVDTRMVNVEMCNIFRSFDWLLLCTTKNSSPPYPNTVGGPLVYKDPELKVYLLVGFTTQILNGHDLWPPREPKDTSFINAYIYPFLDWIQEIIERKNPPYHSCQKLEMRP